MLGYLTLSSSQTAGRSCEKGYRSWDSQFFKTHVTPKGWDVKGAYHRMLVGGLDVVKRANAETR